MQNTQRHLLCLAAAALSVAAALPAHAANSSSTGKARTERCKPTSQREIAQLFDRWNSALKTGDAHKVVMNYDKTSLLLPTMSNQPRFTAEEKEDYFHHFLENHPSGKIDTRQIQIGCNTAIDVGLYTFSFAKTGASVSGRYSFTYRWTGKQWLITSHHSSAMPERAPAASNARLPGRFEFIGGPMEF